jgi:hypothetical protein
MWAQPAIDLISVLVIPAVQNRLFIMATPRSKILITVGAMAACLLMRLR